MSTDLLGSGLLLGLEPGGEPTNVNRTRDTLPWKKLSQLATLGYFTSGKKKFFKIQCNTGCQGFIASVTQYVYSGGRLLPKRKHNGKFETTSPKNACSCSFLERFWLQ